MHPENHNKTCPKGCSETSLGTSRSAPSTRNLKSNNANQPGKCCREDYMSLLIPFAQISWKHYRGPNRGTRCYRSIGLSELGLSSRGTTVFISQRKSRPQKTAGACRRQWDDRRQYVKEWLNGLSAVLLEKERPAPQEAAEPKDELDEDDISTIPRFTALGGPQSSARHPKRRNHYASAFR